MMRRPPEVSFGSPNKYPIMKATIAQLSGKKKSCIVALMSYEDRRLKVSETSYYEGLLDESIDIASKKAIIVAVVSKDDSVDYYKLTSAVAYADLLTACKIYEWTVAFYALKDDEFLDFQQRLTGKEHRD